MKLHHLPFSRHFHSLSLLIIIIILFHSFFITVVHAQPVSDLQQDDDAQYLRLGPELSRPIAVVIVAFALIFFIMVFLSVYLRHYLELNAASDAVLRAAGVERCGMCQGLDPAEIRKFPVVAHSAIKETKIGKCSLECAVCLSEFQDYETLRLLPKCGHVFHPSCIDAWLASCATCPICRAKLAVAGGEDSASEFVAISVVDEGDRNGDGESEAVETSNEEVCEMEKSVDVAGGDEEGDN